jgi:hypothetical protein
LSGIHLMALVLDRPIFLVGHARAGSTALAAILNAHPDVGPKPPTGVLEDGEFVSSLLDYEAHLCYADQLEQKRIWFSHCGGEDVFTHMGKELVRDESFVASLDRDRLVSELTAEFRQRRFLSKAPTNTFRLRLLAALFPDAKFVVLYRTGEEVVASWGKRPYGFGHPANWGEMRTDRLGYFRGINVFSRKWRETIDYAESCRGAVPMLRMTYRQLVENPRDTLDRLAEFLELESTLVAPPRLEKARVGAWREVIPPRWRPYLRWRCRAGNRVLDRIEREVPGAAA